MYLSPNSPTLFHYKKLKTRTKELANLFRSLNYSSCNYAFEITL